MNKIPYYANCNVERMGGGGIPCALGDTIKQSKPNRLETNLISLGNLCLRVLSIICLSEKVIKIPGSFALYIKTEALCLSMCGMMKSCHFPKKQEL